MSGASSCAAKPAWAGSITRERNRGDGQRERSGRGHLNQGESVLAHHPAFRVLTPARRASPGVRATPLPSSAWPLVSSITRTFMTIA